MQQNRCILHARLTFSPVRHGQGKLSRSKFVVKVVMGTLNHVSLAVERHFATGSQANRERNIQLRVEMVGYIHATMGILLAEMRATTQPRQRAVPAQGPQSAAAAEVANAASTSRAASEPEERRGRGTMYAALARLVQARRQSHMQSAIAARIDAGADPRLAAIEAFWSGVSATTAEQVAKARRADAEAAQRAADLGAARRNGRRPPAAELGATRRHRREHVGL